MFVKSLPKQCSVHFFCSPPTFFSSHPEKNIILSPLTRRNPPSVDYATGHIFYSPAASTRKPPRLASRFGTSFTRWARNCASLLTAHRTLPRRAQKMGRHEGKIGGFRRKTGVFRSKHPRFYLPACTHAAQARTKKGLHPNSFVQSFIF